MFTSLERSYATESAKVIKISINITNVRNSKEYERKTVKGGKY